MMPTKNVIELMPYTIKAMKYLGVGKWKSRVGSWCVWKGKICLVTGEPFHRNGYDTHGGMRPVQEGEWVNCKAIDGIGDISHKVENLIPLLHWEDDIQPSLEKLGYWFHWSSCSGSCEIHPPNTVNAFPDGWGTVSNSRQLSVMIAVISLVDDVKKEASKLVHRIEMEELTNG